MSHKKTKNCGTCAHKERTSRVFASPVTWECEISKEEVAPLTSCCDLHSGLTKAGHELINNRKNE